MFSMRRTKPTPLASRPVKSFAATARVRHGTLKRLGCGFANQTNYERRIPAYATARDAA